MIRTKFGTSMFSWIPRWSTEGGYYAISKAAELGFDLLEISLPPDLDVDIKKLQKALSASGIEARFTHLLPKQCHVPFYPVKALKQLQGAIDIVEQTGGNFLGGVLHASIGVFTGEPCTKEERGVVKDILSESAIYAAQRGIMLALEPVNRYETYLLTSAGEILNLIEEIGANNLTLMLDTFHMNIEENGFYGPVTNAGEVLRYMHLASSDRGMPGKDNVRWNELFKGLSEIDYEGDLVLENLSTKVKDLQGLASLWRDQGYDADELATGGLAFIRQKAAEHGRISFINNTATFK